MKGQHPLDPKVQEVAWPSGEAFILPPPLSLVSVWWAQCLVLRMRRNTEVPCATGVRTLNNPRAAEKNVVVKICRNSSRTLR